MSLTLRDTVADDLAVLFTQQLDPEALRMAAFPPRTRDEFMSHWARVLQDDATVTSTILVDGEIAGYVTTWLGGGGRQVGYWLGRAFWGRGVASRALSQFTSQFTVRPLTARVAIGNGASIRVLEKCGFVRVGSTTAAAHDDGVEELMFELA
jgi:RimJ/RimL family protein N-acetyltransferase